MRKRSLTGSLATLSVLLTTGLTGCGHASAPSSAATTADAGAEARVSPAARDKIAKVLIAEYNGISWYSDAEKKQKLLEAIVGTGSDLAVDLLLAEYNGLSWYSDKSRKLMFLDLLQKLTAAPSGETPKQSMTKVSPSKPLPSHKALGKVADALQKDLKEAPKDAKPRIQAIINHVFIISPNTGR